MNTGFADGDTNDINFLRTYLYVYPKKVAEAVSKGYYEPQPVYPQSAV